MSEREGRCGPHTTITSNDTVRITQCTCGVYHVNFVKKGVSIQMGIDDVRRLTEGVELAVRVADAETRGKELVGETN